MFSYFSKTIQTYTIFKEVPWRGWNAVSGNLLDLLQSDKIATIAIVNHSSQRTEELIEMLHGSSLPSNISLATLTDNRSLET